MCQFKVKGNFKKGKKDLNKRLESFHNTTLNLHLIPMVLPQPKSLNMLNRYIIIVIMSNFFFECNRILIFNFIYSHNE